jgi:hypothetical protein
MSDRNRSRHAATLAIVAGVAFVLGLAAIVVVETLSDKSHRDAERQQEAAAQPEASSIKEACAGLPTFDEVAACIIEKAKAAHDFAHDNADLHAQEDVAAWTNGLFWFAALGFLATAGGLVALIATFYAQMKLARDQTRGWIEILVGRVTEHPELGFRYHLDVLAHGNTRVTDIEFLGQVTISGVPWSKSIAARTHQLAASVEELAPDAKWTLTSRARENEPGTQDGHWIGLEHLAYPSNGGTAALRYGCYIRETDSTEVDPELVVTGALSYKDIYGRTHSLKVHQFIFIDFNGLLRGTGSQAPTFAGVD